MSQETAHLLDEFRPPSGDQLEPSSRLRIRHGQEFRVEPVDEPRQLLLRAP
jgi:hypothetical protein